MSIADIANVDPLVGESSGIGKNSAELDFVRFLDQVSQSEKHAKDMATEYALGADVDLQEVLLSSSKADISLRTFVTLRNRVAEAYQQIMTMG